MLFGDHDLGILAFIARNAIAASGIAVHDSLGGRDALRRGCRRKREGENRSHKRDSARDGGCGDDPLLFGITEKKDREGNDEEISKRREHQEDKRRRKEKTDNQRWPDRQVSLAAAGFNLAASHFDIMHCDIFVKGLGIEGKDKERNTDQHGQEQDKKQKSSVKREFRTLQNILQPCTLVQKEAFDVIRDAEVALDRRGRNCSQKAEKRGDPCGEIDHSGILFARLLAHHTDKAEGAKR